MADARGKPPAEAFAAALSSLPGMGPARLDAVLGAWSGREAWARVMAGSVAEAPVVAAALGRRAASLPGRWQVAARDLDPADCLAAHAAAGVGVAVLGSPAYPEALAADVEAPAVVFHRGRPDLVAGPRVAVVGTRRCTRYGRDVARSLGADLAAAGVRVVSGLALGIDGAAHEGALSAGGGPPVAVVGSGLDVVYPRRHADLWQRVEAAGVVISEAPVGARPEPWRFPSRNRLLAALADVVVVVESHEHGGSLYTVDTALERDVPVMAVPGPVHSAPSAGCNRLLVDGVHAARDADDVLSLLGLSRVASTRGGADERRPPTTGEQAVLEAFSWQPATLDQLALRCGAGLAALALALEELQAAGWITANGGWYERVARPDR